jgi:hypothetical protein
VPDRGLGRRDRAAVLAAARTSGALSSYAFYSADVFRLYRAANAIATSNAFTADGTDRHFAWCAGQSGTPEVSRSLQLRL